MRTPPRTTCGRSIRCERRLTGPPASGGAGPYTEYDQAGQHDMYVFYDRFLSRRDLGSLLSSSWR